MLTANGLYYKFKPILKFNLAGIDGSVWSPGPYWLVEKTHHLVSYLDRFKTYLMPQLTMYRSKSFHILKLSLKHGTQLKLSLLWSKTLSFCQKGHQKTIWLRKLSDPYRVQRVFSYTKTIVETSIWSKRHSFWSKTTLKD